MRLVIIILCIACLASIAYIRKKGRKTQRGGADPALVGMLFLVLVSGGLGIAYELNDDFKGWVNDLIGGDDGVKPGCAKNTTEASCPSPTCQWKDSACKDKDSEVQTTDPPTLTCDSHRTQSACNGNPLCQWAASPSPGQCNDLPPSAAENMKVRFNTPYQIVSTTLNRMLPSVPGPGKANFNLPGKLIAFLSNGKCRGTGGRNNGWCVGYAVDGFDRMGPEGDTMDRKSDPETFPAISDPSRRSPINPESLLDKDTVKDELKVRGNTKAFKFIKVGDSPGASTSTDPIKYSDVFKIVAIHPPNMPLEYSDPTVLRKGPFLVNWDLGSADSVPDIVSLDIDDLGSPNYANEDMAGIQNTSGGLDKETAEDQIKWKFDTPRSGGSVNVTINTDLYIRLAREVPNDSKRTATENSHGTPYGAGHKYLTPWYATQIGRAGRDNGRWTRVDDNAGVRAAEKTGRLMPISDGVGSPNTTNLNTQGKEIPYAYHVVAIRSEGNGCCGQDGGQSGAQISKGYKWKIQHACGDAEENMQVPVSPCPFKLKPSPGPTQEVCCWGAGTEYESAWCPSPRYCGRRGGMGIGNIRTGHYYRDIFASSVAPSGGYRSDLANLYKQGKCPDGIFGPSQPDDVAYHRGCQGRGITTSG